MQTFRLGLAVGAVGSTTGPGPATVAGAVAAAVISALNLFLLVRTVMG